MNLASESDSPPASPAARGSGAGEVGQESVLSFLGNDVAEAVRQARGALGPDALVVEVRRVPQRGLSRFWRRGQVELRARSPVPRGGTPPEGLTAGDGQGRAWPGPRTASAPRPGPPDGEGTVAWSFGSGAPPGSSLVRPTTRVLLERLGLLPGFAEQVLARLPEPLRGGLGATLTDDVDALRGALLTFWRPAGASVELRAGDCHVFVGAPGSGKTTALCKWLTQSVLQTPQQVRVWRLDTAAANTAEWLSVMGEILGVRVERHWPESATPRGEVWLVDLPGPPPGDPAALAQLDEFLRRFSNPQIHLTLNAAYEASLMVSQARSFSRLGPADVVLTHLDEAACWGKAWNLLVGTDYSLSFLSAGQNIPGGFEVASPQRLFPRFF